QPLPPTSTTAMLSTTLASRSPTSTSRTDRGVSATQKPIPEQKGTKGKTEPHGDIPRTITFMNSSKNENQGTEMQTMCPSSPLPASSSKVFTLSDLDLGLEQEGEREDPEAGPRTQSSNG